MFKNKIYNNSFFLKNGFIKLSNIPKADLTKKNFLFKIANFNILNTNCKKYKNSFSENLNNKKKFFEIQTKEYSQNDDLKTSGLNNSNENSNEYHDNINLNKELLLLSKSEKVFSKVLLRNIRYYDKNNFSNQNKNNLYEEISNKLIKNFNFSEESQDINDHYLIDENNVESNIINSTQKKFYVDWMNSNLSQGKFVIKIKSQSKNIIFEDLFTNLRNLKDENSLFVVNFDNNTNEGQDASNFNNQNEDDLLSDGEDIPNANKNILDYPKDFLEENKDRGKFDLVYHFDKNKPNQLIFFCEKLFVNDIITAEELSEIKKLAFISGRHLKYTQNQSIEENQYNSFTEVLEDIRILEKLERLNELQNINIVYDLNLLYSRRDHTIKTKIKLPNVIENQFIYVITNNENLNNLLNAPGINKVDTGEFFSEFVNMIDKNSYNKKYKLFISKENLDIITQKNEEFERFLEVAKEFKKQVQNNDEEIVNEVNIFRKNLTSLRLNNNNKIEADLGDLSFSDKFLHENFSFLKKQILRLKPKSLKSTYIKSISIFVNNEEFRIKIKE